MATFMKKSSVIILGAGGHARVLLDILLLQGEVEVLGFLDPSLKDCVVQGVRVIGDDSMLPALREQADCFIVGVGSNSDTRARINLFEQAVQHGYRPLSTTHPTAIVASTARIGEGTALLAGSIVNPNAHIGKNVILNTGCIVEHDCDIGDHVHIAPGVVLSGGVTVGEGTHVGTGAVIRQKTRLGKHAVVGAGAVVVKPVPDGTTVVGNPARVFQREMK
jgi:UDP-perosamine 4-acetyltransferase